MEVKRMIFFFEETIGYAFKYAGLLRKGSLRKD
jgi:hypothetical protein